MQLHCIIIEKENIKIIYIFKHMKFMTIIYMKLYIFSIPALRLVSLVLFAFLELTNYLKSLGNVVLV